jgi:hypothetical protein
MPSCGATVHSWIDGIVRSAGVFSSGDVVRMGTIGVTMLHPQGSRSPELPPPPPKVVSPSLEDSSRTVCKDGDPLCIIPMNTTPESFPLGERLRWSKWSAVKCKLPKQMVSPGTSPTPIRLLPLAMKVSFS